MKPTRARSCDGKIPHQDRAAAQAHAASLRSRGAVRLRAYRCPWCGHWHVGHLPKPRKTRR